MDAVLEELCIGLIAIIVGILQFRYKKWSALNFKKTYFNLGSDSLWEKVTITVGVLCLIFGFSFIFIGIAQML